MKTFNLYRNKESRLSENLHHYAHKFYLSVFLKKWNKREETKHRIYDNYGMIDTLGFNSDSGVFAYSYSDELTYLFGFNFYFFKVEFIN